MDEREIAKAEEIRAQVLEGTQALIAAEDAALLPYCRAIRRLIRQQVDTERAIREEASEAVHAPNHWARSQDETPLTDDDMVTIA